MAEPCTVVVTLLPKKGCADEVVSIINRELVEIRLASGCQRYELYRGVDNRVVLIEQWATREHWQNHFDTPAIERLKRDLTPLLSQPAERAELDAAQHLAPHELKPVTHQSSCGSKRSIINPVISFSPGSKSGSSKAKS